MPVCRNSDDQDVKAVAEEIVSYLRNSARVADTIDGIMEWWIPRQRLREERQRVEKALDYLCAQGQLERRKLPDGSVLYSASEKPAE